MIFRRLVLLTAAALISFINGTFANAAEHPSESLQLLARFSGENASAQSWLLIAGPGAAPTAVIEDASLLPAGRDDKVTTQTLANLPAKEREQAIASIQAHITIQPKGYLRYWRIYQAEVQNASATVGPVTYQVPSMTLQIKNLQANAAPAAPSLPIKWGYLPVLQRLVENGKDALSYIDPSAPLFTDDSFNNWSPTQLPKGTAVFSFETDKDGFVRILPENLAKAGISPQSIDPHHLSLYSRGAVVPCFIQANGDKSFQDGEYILFYGRQSESKYSLRRTYWLVVNANAGPYPIPVDAWQTEKFRFPERESFPAKARIGEDNQDVHEQGNFLEIRDVRWIWKTMTGDQPTTFTFNLPDLSPAASNSSELVDLSLEFYHLPSDTENLPANYLPAEQRKITARINGVDLGEQVFTSYRDREKKFQIPLSVLKREDNYVEINLGAQSNQNGGVLSEGTYFDALTVNYPSLPVLHNGLLQIQTEAEDRPTSQAWTLKNIRNQATLQAYDLTDPEQPKPMPLLHEGSKVQLPGGFSNPRTLQVVETDMCSSAPLQAWKPSTLRNGQNAADYLIISHPSYIDLLRPLIDQKTKQGMKVQVVSIADVFDEFSAGENTPFAIKRLIAYALKNWKVPPTYVLLVGDSTSDYRNNLRVHIENQVPSYREESSTKEGETWSSDHWFSRVFGDDDLPDVIIGRLSVVNREDAREVIRKQVMAQDQLPLGPWRNRFLLVSDEDSGFEEACDEVENTQIPRRFFVQHIDLARMPWERNWYLDRDQVDAENLKVSNQTTQAILDAFNRGIGFLAFWGHGAPNIWTDQRIWFGMDSTNSDNLLLRNGDLLPFVMNMTCNTGAIDYPKLLYNICISEDMMRVKAGGARSLFVPSGPGATPDHQEVSKSIVPALLHSGLQEQGDAILLGRARYLFSPRCAIDYVRMYQLLGDPAMPLPIPQDACKIVVANAQLDLRQKPKNLGVQLENLPFQAGNVVFQLQPPNKSIAPIETETLSFTGSASFSLNLPPQLIPGNWHVKAYCWNMQTQQDASGYAPFIVDTPYAQIDNFRVADSAKSQKNLQVELSNPTLLPIRGLSLEVTNGNQRLFAETIDLAAGEKRTWHHAWSPQRGVLYDLSARLTGNPAAPITQSTICSQKNLAWSWPDTGKPLELAISATDQKIEFRSTSPRVEVDMQMPVLVVKGSYSGSIPVAWGWGDAVDESTSATLEIKPGENRGVCRISLAADPGQLPRPFTVEVDPHHTVLPASSAPVRLTSTLDLNSLPDLTFSRTKGVAVKPKLPSDSQTVIFGVPIKNRGNGDAGYFRITAYDADPTSGGLELPNAAGNSYAEIQGLAAGAETDAVIRWDPKESAGNKRIFFKIDSMDRVTEISKKNNTAAYPIHIRTLANLEPVGFRFDVPELMRLQRVRVIASVRNSGETEARNIMVAFFSDRAADPKNKMGERLIERIAPGQTLEQTFEWPIPQHVRQTILDALKKHTAPENIRIDACAQFYLRGSLQRVLVAPQD